MQKLILLFLITIPFLNFAQKNEIAIGISGFDNQAILKNPNISYHRMLNNNMALGFRASYSLDTEIRNGDQSSWQLDLVQRYEAKTKGRLSMSLEGGASFSRHNGNAREYSDYILIDSYYDPSYQKKSYWGFVTGAGVHWKIIKNNKIGINFRYNYWRNNENENSYYFSPNKVIRKPSFYFSCANTF